MGLGLASRCASSRAGPRYAAGAAAGAAAAARAPHCGRGGGGITSALRIELAKKGYSGSRF